jgi:hypothetical protein
MVTDIRIPKKIGEFPLGLIAAIFCQDQARVKFEKSKSGQVPIPRKPEVGLSLAITDVDKANFVIGWDWQ